MRKESGVGTLIVSVAFICLLFGGFLGFLIAPSHTSEVNELSSQIDSLRSQIIQDKGKLTQCENAFGNECEQAEPIEKIVVKEVPVDYIGKAKAELLKDIEDNEDLEECEEEIYDEEQIVIRKISDEYSVEFSEDIEVITLSEVRLKYLDSDVEEKCYREFEDVSVTFEEDEEPIINWGL